MWKSLPQWARGLIQFIIGIGVLLLAFPFVARFTDLVNNSKLLSWTAFIAIAAVVICECLNSGHADGTPLINELTIAATIQTDPRPA
jgi:hypothetical protein